MLDGVIRCQGVWWIGSCLLAPFGLPALVSAMDAALRGDDHGPAVVCQ